MNATEILTQHNIKKTTPRIAIVQALLKSERPLSEAEIKSILGELYDRITFYRNVQTMVEAGIMHRIVVDNIHTKYALNRCSEEDCHHTSHIHFYCKKCSEVTCLDEVAIETKIPDGYAPEEQEIIIHGICRSCNMNH